MALSLPALMPCLSFRHAAVSITCLCSYTLEGPAPYSLGISQHLAQGYLAGLRTQSCLNEQMKSVFRKEVCGHRLFFGYLPEQSSSYISLVLEVTSLQSRPVILPRVPFCRTLTPSARLLQDICFVNIHLMSLVFPKIRQIMETF